MHMLSKDDLTSEELETLRRSRTSTTVVPANGKCKQTREAQEIVYDLDLFVTVLLLSDTPCSSITWKLC